MQLTTGTVLSNVSCFVYKSTQATIGNPSLARTSARAGTPTVAVGTPATAGTPETAGMPETARMPSTAGATTTAAPTTAGT